MNYKSKIIVLTILLVLSFSITIQAETLSLLSSSDLTATPETLFIKLKINSADGNKSRLENRFAQYVNDLKSTLRENSDLRSENIVQSQVTNSSYSKNTGYNNPQIYEKKVYLKLSISQQDPEKLHTITESIIDLIDDNMPQSSNASYNSLSDLELNYEQGYYYFADPQSLQEKILNDILQKNKRKSKTLANLLKNNSAALTKIEEIKSADIPNYQQEIDLQQPQAPQEVEFDATLRIDYQTK